jgi:hypothetical protein
MNSHKLIDCEAYNSSVKIIQTQSKNKGKFLRVHPTKMGIHKRLVSINLPPRYIEPMMKESEKDNNQTTRIRINFNIENNQIHEISTIDSKYTSSYWYNKQDYANFVKECEKERQRRAKEVKTRQYQLYVQNAIASSSNRIPALEELPSMQPEQTVCRKNLIQSILLHQATCRAKGYCDPSGYAYLSKALSKKDRKVAWQTAAVNAYETYSFLKETMVQSSSRESSSSNNNKSTLELFEDYYLKSIHPLLSSPMILMSKLLCCECD